MKILTCGLLLIVMIAGCAKRQDESPNIPTLSGFSMPAKKLGDAPFKLIEPISNSTGVISYTSNNANVATVFGNIITITGIGTATITAHQQRLGRFVDGDISADLNVVDFADGQVTDIDSNIYRTVKIGTQEWMVENLKVTRYRDGTPIPNVTEDRTWNALTTGAFCDYGNEEAKGKIYGKLYNWYAIEDRRKLAPAGWHIPSNDEWLILYNYIGGIKESGKELKEVGTQHWYINAAQTNSTHFTAYAGGYRNEFDGVGMGGFGYDAIWWSSTFTGTINKAWAFHLYLDNSFAHQEEYLVNGFSVRCIKD
jgi:uncharacterized protein (TIGR02145 family)